MYIGMSILSNLWFNATNAYLNKKKKCFKGNIEQTKCQVVIVKLAVLNH